MNAYGPWWEPEDEARYGPPAPLSGAPPEPPPRRSRSSLVVLLLSAAVFGAGVGHYLWSGGSPAQSRGQAATPPGTVNRLNPLSVADRVDPELVDINTSDGYQGVLAAGTGMVLTSSGEVLTNNHVIEGATSITAVDVGNGRRYRARVLGYSRSGDIALLQLVGARSLPAVRIGDSSRVRTGEAVVALGNAGGSGGRPTYAPGTITGLNQSITATDAGGGSSEQLSGLLETDADVVPGDSGGPLADGSGRVLGMDTAASAGFQFQNSGSAGFAVPIDVALRVARQIRAGRASSSVHVGPTAFLGVQVRDAAAAGPGFGSTPARGALVAGVVSGGPADQAGLTPGDVITALDGHSVASATALTDLMLVERPGAAVPLDYVGPGGRAHTVTLRLGSGPPQ